MIRGVYRDGLIYPEEPVPPDWADGQPVRVEPQLAEPSNDPTEIDRWAADWQRSGPLQYEPGERERIAELLAESDALAKEQMRRHMGLNGTGDAH